MEKEINLNKLIEIQKLLSKKVIKEIPNDFSPKIITGVDISYSKKSNIAVVMAVSTDISGEKIIEKKYFEYEAKFPYISGFLGFREVPYFRKVLLSLKKKPDLILVDGFGILHPRLFGSAAHLGVIIHKSTIGIGKSKFVGKAEHIPDRPNNWAYITFNGKILGAILKPNTGKPIYISVGNLIDLETAINIVIELIKPVHRIPEPLYLADKLSRELIIKINNSLTS